MARAHGRVSAAIRAMVAQQIAEAFPAVERECPRCRSATAFIVVTLNGPYRGSRCFDCWEAEP